MMPRKAKLSFEHAPAPITYHVERVTGDRWDVIAKVQLASCPNQIMAEVVASAIDTLQIPLVKGVRLPVPIGTDPSVMPELKPFKLKGRKPRADKGKPRGTKKKKAKSRRS